MKNYGWLVINPEELLTISLGIDEAIIKKLPKTELVIVPKPLKQQSKALFCVNDVTFLN